MCITIIVFTFYTHLASLMCLLDTLFLDGAYFQGSVAGSAPRLDSYFMHIFMEVLQHHKQTLYSYCIVSDFQCIGGDGDIYRNGVMFTGIFFFRNSKYFQNKCLLKKPKLTVLFSLFFFAMDDCRYPFLYLVVPFREVMAYLTPTICNKILHTC